MLDGRDESKVFSIVFLNQEERIFPSNLGATILVSDVYLVQGETRLKSSPASIVHRS